MEDALAPIEAIERLAAEVATFERYETDEVYRWAIERQCAVLGEALFRVDDLDPDLRAAVPELGEVIGMRNMIEYEYDAIDDLVMWTTIVDDLAPLARRLRSVLVGQSIESILETFTRCRSSHPCCPADRRDATLMPPKRTHFAGR